MNFLSCPRSRELESVLKSGCLPGAWDDSLRHHVQTCSECRDYAVVHQAFRAERRATMDTIPAVSPGVIWWRAQLRKRKEALELLGKPTSIAGRLAFLSTVVLAFVFFVWQGTHVSEWWKWISNLSTSSASHFESFWTIPSGWSLLLPLSMLGLLALLGGFALYLATDKS